MVGSIQLNLRSREEPYFSPTIATFIKITLLSEACSRDVSDTAPVPADQALDRSSPLNEDANLRSEEGTVEESRWR
jgi:hypothetical protein